MLAEEKLGAEVSSPGTQGDSAWTGSVSKGVQVNGAKDFPGNPLTQIRRRVRIRAERGNEMNTTTTNAPGIFTGNKYPEFGERWIRYDGTVWEICGWADGSGFVCAFDGHDPASNRTFHVADFIGRAIRPSGCDVAEPGPDQEVRQ